MDDGAAQALVERGKSLLPCGVVEVGGDFEAGEIVEVAGPDGTLGRGVARFPPHCSDVSKDGARGKFPG